MDGGIRLARWLMPKRRAAARAYAPARSRHPALRLLNCQVPRGLGSSAAALLLLASVCYGVVRGGHAAEIAAQVQDICDEAANAAGFGISEVALSGERGVSREEILALAGITGHSSLLFLDAGQTRARLLTNPWIADATVLKLYPSRLRIEIKERQPFALWQDERPRLADRRRRHRARAAGAGQILCAAAGGRQGRRRGRRGVPRPCSRAIRRSRNR